MCIRDSHVLTEEVKQHTIIYVDDILCFSQSEEEHMEHLKSLLDNLKKANITVNLKKSQFFRKEIPYLGYCLTTKGIKPTTDKVSAILNFPSPRNPKQLKGFLGLTNFYNKFTSRYAECTQPLLQLLKKGIKFKWDKTMEEQFQLVKELFIESVVLKFPIQGRRFYLQCDASNYAYGGQLYQIDKEGEIAVIAYTSRTFKNAEKNYFTTEKELLAIVQCLKKFRIYIIGQPLTILTDNKALTFIQKCHLNNTRIARWILAIQEYNFEILHCRGKDNVVADLLSRYPEGDTINEPIDEKYEYYIHTMEIKMNKDITTKLRKIHLLQMENKKLGQLINRVKEGDHHKLNQHFKVINNKLYRRWKTQWKLYIPKEIRKELIQEIHQIYGHPGTKRTLQLLKEHFTFEEMCKSVSQLIRCCDLCQRCKDSGNRLISGETRPILPTRNGELLSMDYYGPLPMSSGGVKYLLVIVDNFTKYVELYALRRATTNITLKRLQQYIDCLLYTSRCV